MSADTEGRYYPDEITDLYNERRKLYADLQTAPQSNVNWILAQIGGINDSIRRLTNERRVYNNGRAGETTDGIAEIRITPIDHVHKAPPEPRLTSE